MTVIHSPTPPPLHFKGSTPPPELSSAIAIYERLSKSDKVPAELHNASLVLLYSIDGYKRLSISDHSRQQTRFDAVMSFRMLVYHCHPFLNVSILTPNWTLTYFEPADKDSEVARIARNIITPKVITFMLEMVMTAPDTDYPRMRDVIEHLKLLVPDDPRVIEAAVIRKIKHQ